MTPHAKHLDVVFYLYPGMTALDAIGPYEVLRGLPGATIRFAAKERGAVLMDSLALSLNAHNSIRKVDSADILVIPGGGGSEAQLRDEEVLDWVRRIHAQSRWTTSVCTGSLILAAAGLLEGLEATCHWRKLESLRPFGANPVSRRVVRQGKIITAAGVSAGIDMALQLVALEAGDTVAQAIQLAIEYDPQPPFDSGCLEKAPAALADYVRSILEKNEQASLRAVADHIPLSATSA